MKKVIIIGGGASGLYAAAAAASAGASAVLLEKNSACGRKLNICGKGRGNVTNTAPLEDFIEAFGRNGRFLYSAFSAYFSGDLREQLRELGVETVAERGGRVFPAAGRASLVTDALTRRCLDLGVRIKTGTKALALSIDGGAVTGVRVFGGDMSADRVIVATGGLSYPATGSTGDGYAFARAAGHTVTPLRPSLCGLILREDWPGLLSGLSLKNVSLALLDRNGKRLARETGEMLFTHQGVSGPIVLTLSKTAAENEGPLSLSLDLKPYIPPEELEAGLRKDFTGKKQLKTYLESRMPKALAALFPGLAGVDNKPLCRVTAEERRRLAACMKGLPLTVKSLCPIEEAIITKGGVSLKEIDPKTMESRLIKGLYFCGEVLDLDAKTGGYNLQAAFSTGYAAGAHAAQ